MQKRFLAIVIVAILFLIVTIIGGFTGELEADLETEKEVVATVDGQTISTQELEEIANIQGLLGQLSQFNQQFVQVLNTTEAGEELLNTYRREKLEELIDEQLLLNQVEKKGLTISESQKDEMFKQEIEMLKQQNNLSEEQLVNILQQQGIASLEEYKEIVMDDNSVLINKLLEAEVFNEITISDSIIEQVYESNKAQFTEPEQVEVSHIVVESEEEAAEIYQELKTGADFTLMAQEKSIDEFSAKEGGNLGYVSQGELGVEFDQVAFNLEKGEISEVIESQFGYQIIRVEDKKEAGTLPLSEVREQIEYSLIQQEQQQAYLNFLESLRDEAEIEIKL